jgi:hypothetical protein
MFTTMRLYTRAAPVPGRTHDDAFQRPLWSAPETLQVKEDGCPIIARYTETQVRSRRFRDFFHGDKSDQLEKARAFEVKSFMLCAGAVEGPRNLSRSF